MVQKSLKKQIQRIVKAMQFYDRYGYLPFQKKRIDITLSGEVLRALDSIKNKSAYVESLIRKDKKIKA